MGSMHSRESSNTKDSVDSRGLIDYTDSMASIYSMDSQIALMHLRLLRKQWNGMVERRGPWNESTGFHGIHRHH